MIREVALARLVRWHEVIIGLVIAALGLWSFLLIGVFFQGIGVLVLLAGLSFAVIGYRRLVFAGAALAPGVVQVVEGQIGYFGPTSGGFVAIRELIELRLLNDATVWFLIPAEGETLEIPVGARGSEALFDAFATLPGLRMPEILRLLSGRSQFEERVIWRRADRISPNLALT
jgi:hypothetical protein